jgi:putative redox protein
MKLNCDWQEKMKFIATADGHQVAMDAKQPIGTDTAMSPKQLLLAGICGCTGIDVVALLKKHKQPLQSLQIEAESESTVGRYPAVFKEVRLLFKLEGKLDAAIVIEAVKLSQTLYCGVSAMVSKVVPISYTIELNGSVIHQGSADFGSL